MIDKEEWESIVKFVDSRLPTPELTVGIVNKRDEEKRQVWVAEFGDEAIPIVGFQNEVKYYDEDSNGVHQVRYATSGPTIPNVGETILISRTGGSRRLPRCLGVIMGESTGPTNSTAPITGGAGPKMRGRCYVPTEESRTNAAFGLLATPDVVTGIVLPVGGLLRVYFQGQWKESTDNAAQAAIFLNSNQVKVDTTASPTGQAARNGKGVNAYGVVATMARGLGPIINDVNANNYAGDVGTGQIISAYDISVGGLPFHGGGTTIFADPGTYDVSIQWLAQLGTVTAKERKLWVEAIAF